MSLLYFCSPSLKRRRQEDQELKVILGDRVEFKASLSYMRTFLNIIDKFFLSW